MQRAALPRQRQGRELESGPLSPAADARSVFGLRALATRLRVPTGNRAVDRIAASSAGRVYVLKPCTTMDRAGTVLAMHHSCLLPALGLSLLVALSGCAGSANSAEAASAPSMSSSDAQQFIADVQKQRGVAT